MGQLILKRASASRPSGEWNDDDFDVLADGEVVGRIFNAAASPVGSPWMWTLIFPHHEGHSPTHGYAANARSCDGGIRQELAEGISAPDPPNRVTAGRGLAHAPVQAARDEVLVGLGFDNHRRRRRFFHFRARLFPRLTLLVRAEHVRSFSREKRISFF